MRKYYAPTRISENIHETPEGYLMCLNVPIARTGEMDYYEGETPLDHDDDGVVTVSRDAEEVFHPKTIASFEGKAITIKHPNHFVEPANWAQLAKGVMQNVRRGSGDQSEDLIADLMITDQFAISLVKNGLRGLSCGYEAEYTQTGKGTGKQTQIVGNHLALVEEGRAGAAYAITDAKGASSMKNKSWAERMKSVFTKAIDEAAKEDMKDEGDPKEDKKEESADESAYDALCKVMNEVNAKLDAMGKGKDEDKPEDKKDDNKGKDEESSEADGMEERLKKLELAVQQILEGMSESEDDESDVITDEDDMEESEDEDVDMTGDTKSRAEILSPGIKSTAKDIKAKALRAAYATKSGKRVIDTLTGGKPSFEKSEVVDMLFVSASEVLKNERAEALSKTRSGLSRDDSNGSTVDADKLNEINKKFYNLK